MPDNSSKLPVTPRENARSDDRQAPIINTRLAQICYILVCLHILFFIYLIIAHMGIYLWIVKEDGWVEYLTVVAFLLAGTALFAAALTERRLFPRYVYIIGACVMVFFVGEEISWGQRIIGFDVPDFWASRNVQGDFTIHNLPIIYLLNTSSVLLAMCIAACAAFFYRKDRIFNIPSPPFVLTLALMATLSYPDAIRDVAGISDILSLIIFMNGGFLLLLLMFALFALFARNYRLFIATVVPMSFALTTSYMVYQNGYTYYSEVTEYLFSVICLFYALMALTANESASQKIAATAAALKSAIALSSVHVHNPPSTPSRKQRRFAGIRWRCLTSWTVVCLLFIAGSIGLALKVYFDAKADIANLKSTYLLVRTIEPTARSYFDVYLYGRDLYYFKQPCDMNDMETPFFLDIFPDTIDVLPLPNNRKQHDLDNRDFQFIYSNRVSLGNGEFGYKDVIRIELGILGLPGYRGVGYILDNDICIATVPLPSYEIAKISTGQYFWGENGVATNLWIAEFPGSGE